MSENVFKEPNKTKTLAFQQRLIRYLLFLAVLTTVISLATAWIEIGHFQKKNHIINKIDKTNSTQISLIPPTPVLDKLPESIIQYETRARQNIPGSKNPAAEAIYEILDPNIMLQNPVNTYAKATFYATQRDAKLDIADMIESRFPASRKDELIGSIIIKTGYDSQAGGYFMGWTDDNFSIVLITSFLNSVPINKKTTLRDHALSVARSMILGVNLSRPPDRSKDPQNATSKTDESKSDTSKSGADKTSPGK